MTPTREIFWNVADVRTTVYLLAGVSLVIALWGTLRHYRRWRQGKEGKPSGHFFQRLKFLGQFLIGHERILRERYPGLMHLSIFWGFGILFLGTLTIAFQEDILRPLFGSTILQGNFYLIYGLLLDLFGLLALAGVVMALYRRYVMRPRRLDNRPSDFLILSMFLLILVTGFLIEGLRLSVLKPPWSLWEPVGWLFAKMLGTLWTTETSQTNLHRVFWWIHLMASLGIIVCIPFSNLFHILSSSLNVFFRSPRPFVAFEPIDFQKGPPFGVNTISDFSWKGLLNLDACTRCGRCQENCPAYLSERSLNPKEIVLDLRGCMNGSSRRKSPLSLPGDVISEDKLWDCTTCQACIDVCPVDVDPYEKIVSLRRSLVMEKAMLPPEYKKIMKNLEVFGDPFGAGSLIREDWAMGVNARRFYQGRDIETLFWVGCTGALYDERTKEMTLAAAKILNKAELDFGILGKLELCCGDPARRMGDEYIFQKIAKQNVHTLKEYGIRRLVTYCPHCYNIFRNEYPPLGGIFEVVSFTELLCTLFEEKRLKTTSKVDGLFTYHDPCYLGRYNGIYDAPRKVLEAILTSNMKEMALSRDRTFCCGGGGGNFWRGKATGRRLEEVRMEQVTQSRVDGLVAACPFCEIMFDSAVRQRGLENSLKITSIVKLVHQATESVPFRS